jgi:tRNA pseudouridine38-40 synthase
LCDVSYDGTNFHGWQKQPNSFTIQETIENALKKIYQSKINTIVAGRTDTGVHALHNYFNFETKNKIPLEKLPLVINKFLPESICINKAFEVDSDFHTRFNAKRRIYKYYLFSGKKTPFNRNFYFHYNKNLNLEKMSIAIKSLIGTFDFSGLRSSSCNAKNAVRTIYNTFIEKNDDITTFHFEANGFLKNMIRIIMGTILEVGLEKKNEFIFQKILLQGKRNLAGKTISPAGLFFYDVIF